MRRLLLGVAALVLTGCASSTAPTPPPSSQGGSASPTVREPAVDRVLAQDLRAPWSVVPLGPDKALISERDSARILLLQQGRTTVAGTLDRVLAQGEGGLLGLAMTSPDAKKVYAYYTSATDNRVVVLDFDGQRVSTERTVLDGIPKGYIHNGGRIAFGPDGFLYVSTGETGQPDLAQDKTSLAGKILRITPGGRPAPGNPDPRSLVWSWGHRNVQGLAWDSAGNLWATEFGQDDVDELNLIEPGGNYGWPLCEGPCEIPGTTNPKATWSPTSSASPSGLAILDDVAWIAALRGRALFQVNLDGRRASRPKTWLDGQFGRLRDVVSTPEGTLWVLTNNSDGRGDPGPGDDRLIEVSVPD